jgi:sulfur carrier protein
LIESKIELSLNGKPREVAADLTLGGLIDHLGIDRKLIAAAYNGDVVKRDLYDSIELRRGDRVELVRMVGGG